jgi:Mce-associated membrane protein
VTPTWYDLLGVAPDAPTDDIRAAWKSAIADLDPGDRRFRTLNEAAEVLLDPSRRAAYDASIEPEPEPEPVSLEKSADPAPPAAEDRVEVLDDQPVRLDQPRRSVPAWLLGVLAVLTAVMVAAAGYLVSQPSDDAIASATSEAQGAAERAVATILAYDYRTMDEDQKASDVLMTPDYRKKFDQLFEVLKDNQPTTKTVVTVDNVVASGIVRSGDDRVQVLVFVNRSRTNAESSQPAEYRDQVVVTMVKSGSDWLVDEMDTNNLAG